MFILEMTEHMLPSNSIIFCIRVRAFIFASLSSLSSSIGGFCSSRESYVDAVCGAAIRCRVYSFRATLMKPYENGPRAEEYINKLIVVFHRNLPPVRHVLMSKSPRTT